MAGHRRHGSHLVVAASILLLAACPGDRGSSPHGGSPSANRGPSATELVPGAAPEDRELRAREVHSYRIQLETGQYLHVKVLQQGVDAVVALHGPEGERLVEVDSPTEGEGLEQIHWLAATSGNYRLDVEALGTAGDGRYSIEASEPAPPTAADRRRVRAATAVAAGDRSSSWETAFGHYEEALSIYRELTDSAGEAYARYRLAFLYWRELGDLRAAARNFDDAARLFESVSNVRLRASALHSCGRVWLNIGEMDRALERFRGALPLWRQVGDTLNETQALNNQGIIYRVLGETDRALELYDEVLARAREMGHRIEEATALNNRGRCYFMLGKYGQALEDLEQALAIRHGLGERSRLAATLTSIGQVHQTRGDLGKALDFFQRAFDLQEKAGDRRGQAVTLTALGEVYAGLSRRGEALAAYDEALSLVHSFGDLNQEAWLLQGIGELHDRLDQPERALELHTRALDLFREGRDSAGEIAALSHLASTYHRRGDLASARRFIERAIDKIEEQRAKPASPALRSVFLATKQAEYGFQIDLLMELHERDRGAGHDARALEVSERARARSQLELLLDSGRHLREGADPALLEREHSLQARINAKEYQRLLRSEQTPSRHPATDDKELRDLLREYERLQGQIRASSASHTLRQPRSLGAEEMRRLLDESTVLLHYRLGEKRSFVWVVDARSIHSFELPDRASIETLARRAYDLLSRSNRRESRMPVRLALAGLSDALVAPVRELLGERRLLIVSDGALQYIPFAALPLPDTGEAMITRYEINTAASASMFAALARRADERLPAPGLIAVVADPVFQSHDPRLRRPPADTPGPDSATARGGDQRRFERLVFARREADAILSLVPPERRYEALGFAANRETLLGGELAGHRILHFATHGDVDARHPELSRLILSMRDEQGRPRPGFLHAHEIYGLDLPADLVVLSACRTALGREIAGEGLVGLSQAFMYAGASRVLVSLWQVDDQATAELMSRFYANILLGGQRPSAALAGAQLAVASESRWNAPYFWAGFVMQGTW